MNRPNTIGQLWDSETIVHVLKRIQDHHNKQAFDLDEASSAVAFADCLTTASRYAVKLYPDYDPQKPLDLDAHYVEDAGQHAADKPISVTERRAVAIQTETNSAVYRHLSAPMIDQGPVPAERYDEMRQGGYSFGPEGRFTVGDI